MKDPTPPELIIERPDLQTRMQRTTSRVLTIVAWSLYLYLWLPLVTLVVWWVSVRFGLEKLQMSLHPPFVDPGIFVLLAELALVAAVLLLGWAEYNRIRFTNRERRKPRPLVSAAQSARTFGVSLEVALKMRKARCATVIVNEHAVPTAVVEPRDA